MNGLIVDSFAGGGGASLGITWGIGRGPDVAINHDAAAITMHAANHPETRHYTEDVWKVSPREVTGGRPVALLWASPDCKHFSRAKGAKPVEKKIRSLAWVVVKWASESRPGVIILENVREFEDWGPLVPRWACGACDWKGTEGQAKLARRRRACPRCEARDLREVLGKDGKPVMVPDPERLGMTFRRFVGRLRGMSYRVEWKVLDAADFGAPTHRRRLFLIARADGGRIAWPAPTHGDPKKIRQTLFDRNLKPWRTAAECIDWSIPCPSIFERKRPLAEATMRRIAMGIKRYVLDNPKPFIVGVGGRMGQSPAAPVDQPNNTITAKNDRAVVVPVVARTSFKNAKTCVHPPEEPFRTFVAQEDQAIVTPVVVPMTHENPAASPEDPMQTVTTQKNKLNVVTPFVVPLTHQGERKGISPDEPMPTVTAAHRGEQAVITPILAGLGGPEYSGKPTPVDRPLGAQTTENHKAIIAPILSQYHGQQTGKDDRCQSPGQPINTLDTQNRYGVVSAFLAKHFTGAVGQKMDEPVGTVTAKDHHSLVAANLVHMNHGGKQDSGLDEPNRTVMSGGLHAALVYSFLIKYFGTAIGQLVDDPMHTATGKPRFGLVTVEINGEPYVIVDIGMRMLTPRELARGQGFPDDYKLTGTQSSQVARIGNSVCPDMAAALVRANLGADQMKAAA